MRSTRPASSRGAHSLTSHTRSTAGDATAAFVSWLVTGAVGPALVALPVNMAADKLANAAVRWLKRLRQTDDLSRLVKAAAGTSVQLSRDEIKDLQKLLEKEQTWSLLAGGRLHEKLQELTGKIADCLSARDGRTVADARDVAGAIARGLVEFAVFELQPEIFQKVVLGRLQQMTDQASALDAALFHMHKDLYCLVSDVKDLFKLVSDRLPPGPADLGEIKIYLKTLIDWLNTDPWPQHQRLGGPVLTPTAIECKLRISAASEAQEQDVDADADELARQCSRLVILGGPGSGKTWLAMRTARICAKEALKGLEDGATLDEVELPLYTTCSRLISTSSDIREAAVSSALNWIGDLGGSRIIKALCLSLTERKDEPTLLVIDSLDEASDANIARQRLRQADSLKQPWRVVLTSRPSSWNNQLKIEKEHQAHQVGELQPLRYPDDVESVIGHWFADNLDRGQALATQISRRPSLQQAATVPLILAFYCILGGGQDQLPEFRHKLYAQVINRMLRSPWRFSSGPLGDVAACREALRNWAWQAAKDQNHPVSGVGQWEDDVPTEDAQLSPAGQVAVDHIAAPQGVPDFDTDQTWRRFVHRSIREYLVAEHVASLPVEHAIRELLPHLWYDPDWEYVAPAALAMHSQHNEVLQELIRRTTGSDQPADDISAIDGCWEFRRFLMAVAAESNEADWSPEAAAIIGQARVQVAMSSAWHVGPSPGWVASNSRALGLILDQLADKDSWTAEQLLAKVIALAVTDEGRRQALELLAIRLSWESNHWTISKLVSTIARLAVTPEERRQARDVLVDRLAEETDGIAVGALVDAVASVTVTAENRHQSYEVLLDRLAEVRDAGTGTVLAATLARLTAAPDDRHEIRQALLTRLDQESRNGAVMRLTEGVTRLEPTAEDLHRARLALLRRVNNEPQSWAIPELADAAVRLAATPDDRRHVREGLVARLSRETHPWAVERLSQAVARLDSAEMVPTQAALHQLAQATDSKAVLELGDSAVRLAVTASDRQQARDALLDRLTTEPDTEVAYRLACSLTQLAVTASDRQQARGIILSLLRVTISKVDELARVLTRLDPTADNLHQARELILDRLARNTGAWETLELARVLTQLDPTADDQRQARELVLARLTREEQDGIASDLEDMMIRLAITQDDRHRIYDALVGLLGRETDSLAASRLATALVRLNPVAEDLRQAREALVSLLGRETDSLAASRLATALVRLNPVAEDLRQAREALVGLLGRETDSQAASRLATALVRLNPVAEDLRQAREALVGLLARETRWNEERSPVNALALLKPTVHDLRPLATTPTANLLAAARRNSKITAWLAELPSLRL